MPHRVTWFVPLYTPGHQRAGRRCTHTYKMLSHLSEAPRCLRFQVPACSSPAQLPASGGQDRHGCKCACARVPACLLVCLRPPCRQARLVLCGESVRFPADVRAHAWTHGMQPYPLLLGFGRQRVKVLGILGLRLRRRHPCAALAGGWREHPAARQGTASTQQGDSGPQDVRVNTRGPPRTRGSPLQRFVTSGRS